MDRHKIIHRLERNILEGKLECQAILVDILQQTRAKCMVNLNTSTYDFVGPSIFAYFAYFAV